MGLLIPVSRLEMTSVSSKPLWAAAFSTTPYC